MATRWSDLSESSRRLIIGAAIGEAVLKTAVLIDIRRRPASQIRGSKRMWIIAAVLVNSAGVGPLSYFAFGRRRPAEVARVLARADGATLSVSQPYIAGPFSPPGYPKRREAMNDTATRIYRTSLRQGF